MSAKSLIQKIKDIFGLSGTSGPESEAGAPADDGTDVTVEREPDTATEDAVKGTETDGAETADESGGTDESEPVEEIKGIGPTYRERLQASGIETVADLADNDAAAVADAAETSEGRAADWVQRARNR